MGILNRAQQNDWKGFLYALASSGACTRRQADAAALVMDAASTNELAALDGSITAATVTLSAGAATDEMDITITVQDADGATIAAAHHLEVWISDSATTKVLTSTAASGALTAVDGEIFIAHTAKKHITCVTPVTGVINLSLVDAANTAGEVVYVRLPNGLTAQSAASVATDYEGGV